MVSRTTTPILSGPLINSTSRQNELTITLDMDQALISSKGTRVSLETIWKCYVAITKAISRVGETDWELGKKPTDSEVIGIYGSKSVYYDQAKVLQYVRLYSEMVEWLERPDSGGDWLDMGRSLWGFHKVAYTLKDLEMWIVQKQKESHSDRKGKKKGTASSKGNDDDGGGEGSSK